MKESELQKSILQYLTLKRIFHYQNNSGAFAGEYKGKTRFVRFGALGSPDIVCTIREKYVGIEVKGREGEQSENQQAFQRQLEKAGGRYIFSGIRSMMSSMPSKEVRNREY